MRSTVQVIASGGSQSGLTITRLGSNYTYGDSEFGISTTGGSGTGAVTYTSSDSNVALVVNGVPSTNQATVTILKAGTVTVTATADRNYKFAGWTTEGISVHGSDTISFNMPSNNVTLKANFTYIGSITSGIGMYVPAVQQAPDYKYII